MVVSSGDNYCGGDGLVNEGKGSVVMTVMMVIVVMMIMAVVVVVVVEQ